MGAACGHTFCRACAVEYTGACVGPARCPACHKALTIDLAVAAPVRGMGALRVVSLRYMLVVVLSCLGIEVA